MCILVDDYEFVSRTKTRDYGGRTATSPPSNTRPTLALKLLLGVFENDGGKTLTFLLWVDAAARTHTVSFPRLTGGVRHGRRIRDFIRFIIPLGDIGSISIKRIFSGYSFNHDKRRPGDTGRRHRESGGLKCSGKSERLIIVFIIYLSNRPLSIPRSFSVFNDFNF